MMKSVILLCLFGVIVVTGMPKPQENIEYRVVRQMPNPGGMMGGGMPGGMTGGGNPGNLAMQGLGNIPDPTAWIAKGQEVASQLARGRRHVGQKKNPSIKSEIS